jgi:hypothetical protein
MTKHPARQTAGNANSLKPTVFQTIIRLTGVRDGLIPVDKFDYWETHPRNANSGLPTNRVLRKIEVTRSELDGRPGFDSAAVMFAEDSCRSTRTQRWSRRGTR